MRNASRMSGLRGWIIMAAITAGAGSVAQADPLTATETFRTTATIGTAGVSGAPVVSFQGVDDGTLTSGTPFSLGQFVVSPMPGGGSTTYANTPFEITFTTTAVNGAAPAPNETPVALEGMLNGEVNGNDLSRLSMNFNWVLIEPHGRYPLPIFAAGSLASGKPLSLADAHGTFQTGGLVNTLYATSWNSGSEPIVAELRATELVPEPGSIAVFAGVAALVIRLRCRRKSEVRSTHKNRDL